MPVFMTVHIFKAHNNSYTFDVRLAYEGFLVRNVEVCQVAKIILID